jgi:hypothetical protein
MKFRQLTIASSVCLALAGGSGLANAAITGVPGEALQVVGVVTGGGTSAVPLFTGLIETNIGLRVPITIGQDTVINQYTAPHTTVSGTTTTQVLNDPRIYWTLFNENSVKVEDGYCHVSPGDVVLWTTDFVTKQVQQQQQAGILGAGIPGIPSPVCGPSVRPRFGYVIFETISGADGMTADFAFTAEAMAEVGVVIGATVGLPVFPMADGADPLPAGSGYPVYQNEVITGTGTYNDGFATSPVRYSPIPAGIRLSDADANPNENVVTQMPIAGPAGGSGMSLHVLWFPNNDPNRFSFGEIFDDAEGHCSQPTLLPRQLNAWLYNYQLVGAPTFPPNAPNWANLVPGLLNVDGWMIDLIGAVNGGVSSIPYCSPPYWAANPFGVPPYPGAIFGYGQYSVPEYNFGLTDGVVHAAGVQFAAMENLQVPGWTLHMAMDGGKQ